MPLLGLIGKPVSHSASPGIFGEFFRSEQKHDWQYKLFELDEINDLQRLIDTNPSLIGFNVTIPYKSAIIPFLHSVSEDAASCGAVNTVKVNRKENNLTEMLGYNTDIDGFYGMLDLCGLPESTSAIILGNGGSSKAVQLALSKRHIPYTIVGRKNADLTWEQLTVDRILKNNLVINCTPVGMYPNVHDCPDIPWNAVTEKHCFLDLIYNPAETLFLKNAARRGAFTVNGMPMLKRQAELAWTIFKQNI